MQARDRSWLEAAGLVLVRQRLGSAKGLMFLTVEDETGAANVVVWVKVFEKFRRVLLSSAMLGVRGRIQREGEVVHLVSHQLTDLSAELAVPSRWIFVADVCGAGCVGRHDARRPGPKRQPGSSRPCPAVPAW